MLPPDSAGVDPDRSAAAADARRRLPSGRQQRPRHPVAVDQHQQTGTVESGYIVTSRYDKFNLLNLLGFDLSSLAERQKEPRQ